jgi:hypothetical protein
MRTKSFFLLFLLLAWTFVKADIVKTTSGREIQCIVLQENDDSILIRHGYGTQLMPRSMIASVTKSPVITEESVQPATAPSGERIPPWTVVVASLAKEKWAGGLTQIPATVIDVGAMKDVPYQSYRCGEDFEMNIYGDPDHPACVEIGVYHSLVTDPAAKEHCVNFICSILGDQADAAIVRQMNRTKDLVARYGLTLEITPPTDPDAYGGWWVSVYDQKALDGARATTAELAQIAVPKATVIEPTTKPATPIAVKPVPMQTVASSDEESTAWTPAEISNSRRSSSTAGGSVYVHGYYRSNGTYVQSYTRSSPHRR